MYRDEQRLQLEREREDDARSTLRELLPKLVGARAGRRVAGQLGIAGFLTLYLHPLIAWLRGASPYDTGGRVLLHVSSALALMAVSYLVVAQRTRARVRASLTEGGDLFAQLGEDLVHAKASTYAAVWPLVLALVMLSPFALQGLISLSFMAAAEVDRLLLGTAFSGVPSFTVLGLYARKMARALSAEPTSVPSVWPGALLVTLPNVALTMLFPLWLGDLSLWQIALAAALSVGFFTVFLALLTLAIARAITLNATRDEAALLDDLHAVQRALAEPLSMFELVHKEYTPADIEARVHAAFEAGEPLPLRRR